MKKEQKIVLAGLLIMELLAAVDTSGVTVLVPTLQNYFQIPAKLAGWILIAYLLPFSLFLVPLGWLADYLKKPEKVLIFSIFGFFVSSTLCALAPNEYWLIVFRFIKGICSAGMFTTEFVIIIKYWPEPRRVVEIAVTGIGLGVVIGPIIGGLFAKPELWRYFFLIGSVLGLSGFAAYQSLKKLTPVERIEDKTVAIDLPFSQKAKALIKILFWGMVLNVILSFSTQGLNLLITLHVQEHLGKSALFNGYILALIAFGMVIQNIAGIGSRLVKNLKLASWGSALIFALIVAALAGFSNWVNPMAFILYFCLGLSLGIALSTIELMTLQPLPTKNLSIGNGLIVSCMQAGYALGSLAVPLLYPKWQTNTAYFLSGIIIIIVAVYALAQKIKK